MTALLNGIDFEAKDTTNYRISLLNENIDAEQFEALRTQAIQLATKKEPMWPYWATDIGETFAGSDKLKDQTSFLSVIQDDAGTVIGFSLYSYKAESQTLMNNYTYIAQEHRNKGLGKKISQLTEEKAIQHVQQQGLKIKAIVLEAQYPADVSPDLLKERPFDYLAEERMKFWNYLGFQSAPVTVTYPHENAEELLSQGKIKEVFQGKQFERDAIMYKRGPDTTSDKVAARAVTKHLKKSSYAEYYINLIFAGNLLGAKELTTDPSVKRAIESLRQSILREGVEERISQKKLAERIDGLALFKDTGKTKLTDKQKAEAKKLIGKAFHHLKNDSYAQYFRAEDKHRRSHFRALAKGQESTVEAPSIKDVLPASDFTKLNLVAVSEAIEAANGGALNRRRSTTVGAVAIVQGTEQQQNRRAPARRGPAGLVAGF